MAYEIREQFVRRCLQAKALVLAASLLATLARAGTGDLDPSFADHGRLGPIPEEGGEARFIKFLDGRGILVGGGGLSVYRESYGGRPQCFVHTYNFASKLREDGTVDAAFDGESVPSIEAYDLARRADGSIVAAGRKVTGYHATHRACPYSTNLAVYQLGQDGSLDPSFGTNGVFRWRNGGTSQARSLVLEPDGRIVVAGVAHVSVGDTSQVRLVVLRLLANGSLDDTFGVGGIYVGPGVRYSGQIRIVRTRAGTFRATAATAEGCAIVGLTTSGVLDAGFGEAGIVPVISRSGLPAYCGSLHLLPTGKLLIGGKDSKGGFATRLLANGTRDRTFAAEAAIDGSIFQVTSIVGAAGGKVLVAGTGDKGGSIIRLLPSGDLDTQFGVGGHTWIELLSDYRSTPVVHDMAVHEDGGVLAAGVSSSVGPFVVRLIGDDDRASPGIVGLLENQANPEESDGHAVFYVRRSGGSDGDVSVRYRTQADSTAVAGKDFRPTSGTLRWHDGGAVMKKIVVDILQDDEPGESSEDFGLTLDRPQGGAGIGIHAARIEIQPDGSPAGQIDIAGVTESTEEGSSARYMLGRSHYFSGRVCATLTPRSGTATAGKDFEADAHTVCWEDQDSEYKFVEIGIIDDDRREAEESFTLELSNPTGGAVIGWLESTAVAIRDND